MDIRRMSIFLLGDVGNGLGRSAWQGLKVDGKLRMFVMMWDKDLRGELRGVWTKCLQAEWSRPFPTGGMEVEFGSD